MEECKSTGMLTRDLLASVRLQARPRSSLIPIWLHVMMGVLTAVHVCCMLVGVIMLLQLSTVNLEEIVKWSVAIICLYVALAAANVAGCVGIWFERNWAVNFTIIAAAGLAVLLILPLVVVVMSKGLWQGIYFILPFTLLQIGFTFRLVIMRREWNHGKLLQIDRPNANRYRK